MDEGLHRADAGQGFLNIHADIGAPVLAVAGQGAHPPTQQDNRRHHDRHHQQYQPGELGTGHQQHDQAADQQQQIAQGDRHRGADDHLYQGGVGGQPRQHFAGPPRLEKTGAEGQNMTVHIPSQIGDHSLANPGDHVKAQKAGQHQ